MSKKLIEQAAVLASAVQSQRAMGLTPLTGDSVGAALEVSSRVVLLAVKAMDTAWSELQRDEHGERWALACSMLRNGEVQP